MNPLGNRLCCANAAHQKLCSTLRYEEKISWSRARQIENRIYWHLERMNNGKIAIQIRWRIETELLQKKRKL